MRDFKNPYYDGKDCVCCKPKEQEMSKDVPKIKYRSDVTVELIDVMASDSAVARAARVSTGANAKDIVDPAKDAGLINYLMRDRHGSPFEHNAFTFYIEAPIFVFREFMRHRIASYNEESARYKEIEPVFYVPDLERKLIQKGKVGAYEFELGDLGHLTAVYRSTYEANVRAYAEYQKMLDAGIAREVARGVLPVNIYSSMYVTMNARSMMNFLSLRTTREGTTFPSFPQREIEMVAEKMEEWFEVEMPITYAAFNKNGRVAP
jgi:thymidylate synthase (FAD)